MRYFLFVAAATVCHWILMIMKRWVIGGTFGTLSIYPFTFKWNEFFLKIWQPKSIPRKGGICETDVYLAHRCFAFSMSHRSVFFSSFHWVNGPRAMVQKHIISSFRSRKVAVQYHFVRYYTHMS